ncbi:corepressor interacting with RBPJ 1 [Anabrus simplex]|uniref:corepressor interacting with RBPJ 1 n=1 Tax=Anabrus simplex TaxID=316456 RepID=UPI0035A3BB52
MGKGFNNYMCKKFFHPASRDNLKRVWMAEQKAESYKKKQEELRVQYEKEQDLYTNKAMLSKESKDKLSVNFMYEPPPGTKKEREREDDEPEYKFEWQRKFNAPREDYCKGDSEIRDQPFGIQVRNVRCIKCHKWGHINTDKECPMYNQSSSTDQGGCSMDPSLLVQQMREDGLAMKQSALGLHLAVSEQLPESDEDNGKLKECEIELLKSLSKKQKQKLLKKFKKLEKSSRKQKKKKKAKKESKRVSREFISGRDSLSDERRNHQSKHKNKEEKESRKKIKREESCSSSDSDSESEGSSEDDKSKRHSKLKKRVKEDSRSIKIKREKFSSSSSDNESEANNRVGKDGKVHHSRCKNNEEDCIKRKIKRERLSVSPDSNSEIEHKKTERSSYSREKHGKIDKMAELELKIRRENGECNGKLREVNDSNNLHNNKSKDRRAGNSFEDRGRKAYEHSESRDSRKRHSSESSEGKNHKSKRISSENSKYKKLSDEKPYKRSNYSDSSSRYNCR